MKTIFKYLLGEKKDFEVLYIVKTPLTENNSLTI